MIDNKSQNVSVNRSQGGSVTRVSKGERERLVAIAELMFDLSKQLALEALVLLMFSCIELGHVLK